MIGRTKNNIIPILQENPTTNIKRKLLTQYNQSQNTI